MGIASSIDNSLGDVPLDARIDVGMTKVPGLKLMGY